MYRYLRNITVKPIYFITIPQLDKKDNITNIKIKKRKPETEPGFLYKLFIYFSERRLRYNNTPPNNLRIIFSAENIGDDGLYQVSLAAVSVILHAAAEARGEQLLSC